MTRLNLRLLLMLIALVALALALGGTALDPVAGLWQALTGQSTAAALIMGDIRLPRVTLALLVGAALGASGAALQGLLRNPLADPSLTGASQGAALGAAAAFYFGGAGLLGGLAPALAGLLGAALALALVLWLSASARAELVILAGLAVSALAGAALAALLNFAPNPYAMQELLFWLLGSVADRGWPHLLPLAPALGVGAFLLWRRQRFLAALALGEEVAASLGFQPQQESRKTILGAALLVGAAVAAAGNIGFVGLIAPHLARPLVRHRPDRLLLPAALIGAMLVVAADLLSRRLPPGRELQAGVLTTLMGAPFFLFLIFRERKRWR
jgi:iron complex transport system permease protein